MNKDAKRMRNPATTPEARENQCISMAMNLAEQQLADGTASSQVITHFLKMGSTRENYEQERMRKEMQLMDSKIETMRSQQSSEKLFQEAMDAMKQYSGNQDAYD